MKKIQIILILITLISCNSLDNKNNNTKFINDNKKENTNEIISKDEDNNKNENTPKDNNDNNTSNGKNAESEVKPDDNDKHNTPNGNTDPDTPNGKNTESEVKPSDNDKHDTPNGNTDTDTPNGNSPDSNANPNDDVNNNDNFSNLTNEEKVAYIFKNSSTTTNDVITQDMLNESGYTKPTSNSNSLKYTDDVSGHIKSKAIDKINSSDINIDFETIKSN